MRAPKLRLLTLLVLFSFAASGMAGCGGDDDGGTEPPANRQPTVTLSAEVFLRVLVSGDAVLLSANADDPDGDPLTYAWRTDPAGLGSFDDSTAADPTWTAGATPGFVRFYCEVSDGITDPLEPEAPSQTVGTAVPAGDLTEDTTWGAGPSPYVLMGDVRVPPGVSLTVEPGVEVQFRPTSVGAGSYQRHDLRVEGVLDAMGTGSASFDRIRFQGNRIESGLDTQHEGIRFLSGGSGSLRHVTVRDGDTGVSIATDQSVEVTECNFTDSVVGIELNAPTQVAFRRVRLADNGVGLVNNMASFSMVQSSIRNNAGQGIVVNSGSEGAVASVDSCEFRDNGGVHVLLNSGTSPLQATIRHTNLLPAPDDSPSINLSGICGLIAAELRTNYWSQQAESTQDVLAYFEGGEDCNVDVANWDFSAGDWVRTAYLLSLP